MALVRNSIAVLLLVVTSCSSYEAQYKMYEHNSIVNGVAGSDGEFVGVSGCMADYDGSLLLVAGRGVGEPNCGFTVIGNAIKIEAEDGGLQECEPGQDITVYGQFFKMVSPDYAMLTDDPLLGIPLVIADRVLC